MSSSNLPQYPIPRIEVFSIPNRDNLIKIGRRFYCNFPLCRNTPIASYHFYDIHCYTRHICELCHNCFENLANHICSVPREQIGGSARLPASLPANINLHPFTVIANAQKGTVLTLKMDFDRLVENFTDAIDSIYPELERIFTSLILHFRGLRATTEFDCIMEDVDGLFKKQRRLFSPFQIYLAKAHIQSRLISCIEYLNTSLSVYNEEKSGLKLSQIKSMYIRIGQYTPILPRGYIKTPSCIKSRMVTNIETYNGRCYIYSVLSVICRDHSNISTVTKNGYLNDIYKKWKLI